jgi:hypothetical protein
MQDTWHLSTWRYHYYFFLQMYEKTEADLLNPHGSTKLVIRNVENEMMVENLSQRRVTSSYDILRLVEEGMRNRATSKTKSNDISSRSHAIMTFYVTTPKTFAKIWCVDLAGSERVKEIGAEGQTLVESQQINLSLFHLIRVINSIHKGEKHIPFGDSPLTFLLKDALLENSKTIVIATVSPSQAHVMQIVSTLKFAVSCQKLKTHDQINTRDATWRPWIDSKSRNKTPTREKLRKQTELANEQLPWAKIAAGGARCPIQCRTIGGDSCLTYGEDALKNAAVCLHGYPSDSESNTWLAGCLVYAGFQFTIMIDMPGCGENNGPLLKTRSEYNLVAEGGR